MKILNIENLNVMYFSNDKEVLAVDNVSFSINKGDSIGLVGESGSGKTTLAMAILRLLPSKIVKIQGSVEYNGKNLLEIDKSEFNKLRWKEIAVVFQKSMNSLSPIHKVGAQIEDMYKVHKHNATKKEIKDRVLYLFKLVNLSDRVYNLYPHELSGGMLQRTSIAYSLLFNPSLIVMDEATTALDVVTQGQILREIKRIEKEMDMTRIMITHDMAVVANSCNKVAVMYAGQMMEIGKAEDVLNNPRHPYTKGLINVYPTLKGAKKNLKGIEGSLPDLSKRVKGCAFAPRCNKCEEICSELRPQSKEIKEGHFISCHFSEVNYANE